MIFPFSLDVYVYKLIYYRHLRIASRMTPNWKIVIHVNPLFSFLIRYKLFKYIMQMTALSTW